MKGLEPIENAARRPGSHEDASMFDQQVITFFSQAIFRGKSPLCAEAVERRIDTEDARPDEEAALRSERRGAPVKRN